MDCRRRVGWLAQTDRGAFIVDYQFFIGLFAGSLLTFGYVLRTLKRLYHPLIRAQQAAIREYEDARKRLHNGSD
jgi:hypothetical protein